MRANTYVLGTGLLGLALGALAGCSGGGDGTGTVPQDVITAPDVATDTGTVTTDPDTAEPVDTEPVDTAEAPDTVELPDTVEPPDTVAVDTEDAVAPEDTYDATPTDTVQPIPEPPLPPIGTPWSYWEPCAAGKWHDLLYDVCVQCISDFDCGWSKRCDRGTCTGTSRLRCLSDRQCRFNTDGNNVCLPDILVCGQCYEDWQCPGPNQVCTDNHCVDGVSQVVFCTSDADCATGVCSEVGHCAECNTDAQCGSGTVCRRYRCLPPLSPWWDYHGPVVPSCQADADCAPYGVSCKLPMGLCDLGPVCRDDVDCGAGEPDTTPQYFCSPAGYCEPAQCYWQKNLDTGLCIDSCRELGRCFWDEPNEFGFIRPTFPAFLKCSERGTWLPPTGQCGKCDVLPTYGGVPADECCSDLDNPMCWPSGPCLEGCATAFTGPRIAGPLNKCLNHGCPCSPHAPAMCVAPATNLPDFPPTTP